MKSICIVLLIFALVNVCVSQFICSEPDLAIATFWSYGRCFGKLFSGWNVLPNERQNYTGVMLYEKAMLEFSSLNVIATQTDEGNCIKFLMLYTKHSCLDLSFPIPLKGCMNVDLLYTVVNQTYQITAITSG